MVERRTSQHHEGAQTLQPFDSAIARFCGGFGSINTRRAYGEDLRDFSRFATGFGVGELGQLTVGHIEEYLQNCRKKGLSGATIKRRTASINGLLQYSGMEELARETGNILTRHIGSTEELQPLYSLTGEEVKKLQEVSQNNPRASAIIAIALGTGATLAEMRALNVSDILEKESLRVGVRFRGKKSKREITLDVGSSAIVRKYKGNREGENALFARKKTIKQGEDRLGRQSIFGDVKQYTKKIGRPDINLRVLRQTFIMNIQVKDSKKLAKLLGVGGDYAYDVLLERRRLTQQLPQSGVLFEEATK